jgi:hypothetical protein
MRKKAVVAEYKVFLPGRQDPVDLQTYVMVTALALDRRIELQRPNHFAFYGKNENPPFRVEVTKVGVD